MEYVISDIHGHYDTFCRLMEKIKFCGSDRLYVLGDMIDKGRDGIRLAKTLFAMSEAECIAGNHEYDFLKFFHAKLKTDNDEEIMKSLRAYFPDGYLLDWETVEAFDNLPYYIKKEKFIGVHAGLPLRSDGTTEAPENATREQLVYDRRFVQRNVFPKGEQCIIFGHTPTRNISGADEILFYRSGRHNGDISDFCKIHIDTGVYLGGVLGCVEINTCRAFYVLGERT